MHLLFLSCLKATGLIEKRLYFRLTVKEHIQLKMHKMMCSACAHYEHQSILLEHAIHKTVNPDKIVLDLNAFKLSLISKIGEAK